MRAWTHYSAQWKSQIRGRDERIWKRQHAGLSILFFPVSQDQITIFPLFATKHSSVDSDQHITSSNQISEQHHHETMNCNIKVSYIFNLYKKIIISMLSGNFVISLKFLFEIRMWETFKLILGESMWWRRDDVDDCAGEISFSTFGCVLAILLEWVWGGIQDSQWIVLIPRCLDDNNDCLVVCTFRHMLV